MITRERATEVLLTCPRRIGGWHHVLDELAMVGAFDRDEAAPDRDEAAPDRDQIAITIYTAVVSTNAHARGEGGEKSLTDAAEYAVRAADAILKRLGEGRTSTHESE